MTTETDKKYKKHELRTHIYSRPSMYIGTIDPNTIDTYIIDDDDKIIKSNITFICQRSDNQSWTISQIFIAILEICICLSDIAIIKLRIPIIS